MNPDAARVRDATLVEVLERIEEELESATERLIPGLERAWLVVKVDLAGHTITHTTSDSDAAGAAEQEPS